MTVAGPPAAIILAGGRASRLGGADKAQIEIGGMPLIDSVCAAVAGCAPIVIAGPDALGGPGIRTVREQPPFGGPVAGLAAALPLVAGAERVWLLACDLPRAAGIVRQVERAGFPEEVDAVILQDADGRDQPLAGLYRVSALRRALAALGEPTNASLRRLVAPLTIMRVRDAEGASSDLDTWDDIAAYRAAQERGTMDEDRRDRSHD